MKINRVPFFLLFSFILVLTSFTTKKAKKKVGKFVFIEAGVIGLGDETEEVKSFYAFKTEVTVLDYREFLADLKKNNPADYKVAVYDSTGWNTNDSIGYYEMLTEHYYKHPAFENYPIQNISREAAEMYCVWLTIRLKEALLKDADFDFEVRLPTQKEWKYAASGGFLTSSYAWGGYDLYDKKGLPKCEFNNYSAQNISFNYETNQYEIVHKDQRYFGTIANPTVTESFKPNGFGLYDVCGNVAEMVSDQNVAMGGHWLSAGGDVRIDSEMPFDGNANKKVGFRPVLVIK